MSADRIPWIDLSDYGINLHALKLPSGRVVLVAAGDTGNHLNALGALGFRRTRQGHIVHPETKLTLRAVRTQFPEARVQDMARAAVVRITPAAPATPSVTTADSPPPTPVNATSQPVSQTPRVENPDHSSDAAATDHHIHNAQWLGVNRRGQTVYQDGADNRYLEGEPSGRFGPESEVDYLRLRNLNQLPELALGLVCRADRGEALRVDDLRQLAAVIETTESVTSGAPTVSLHELQEALEVAAVKHLEQPHTAGIERAWQAGARMPEAVFRAAVHLIQHLPPATQRTDQTLALAQFSTPLPLAVAMRALLGPIGTGRSLLEPTAGHGVLLHGLPPQTRITAIEIDPRRAERLAHHWGERAHIINADILNHPDPVEPYDYVIANPPYGTLSQNSAIKGHRTTIRIGEVDFPTQRLDHLILLRTLQQRHPQGRSVFLIGADHPRNHDLDTPAGGSRYLFNLLGDHYHVEAVIGLHGDLYRQQGAGYPLRLVVISEQGTGFPAVPERTPVARTWDDVWTQVKTLTRQIGPSVLERAADTAAITSPAQTSDPAVATGSDANATPLPEPTAVTTEPRPEAEPESVSVLESEPEVTAPDLSLEDELDAVMVYQEPYIARSQLAQATTRVPANMASALSRALDRVEADQDCTVDAFVGRELGLDDAALQASFAPEQIDALALAFHANDRGRSFIEADETGIGKGRVLAGAALRAWRQGRPVIFLTEKANLFSDFYRDLSHIGMRDDIHPLIVNAHVPIIDTERGTVIVPPAREQSRAQFLNQPQLPEDINLVMATYSQVCRNPSRKADWLCAIAEHSGALIILDESHNATGESNTATNVQRIIQASGQPALFSSATYAKRPDSLALYSSVLPVMFRNDDLAGMLESGGAPLQEVFSQMLAEDGVLIRREHDLSNITFKTLPDTARAERNRAMADQLASILEKMAWLGGDIEVFISEENQRLNKQYDLDNEKERQGNRAGLHSVHFGSRLYQLNNLFLLALKIDQAIEFGAQELAAGRKPVFVLENTMESLLKEVVTNRFEEPEATAAESAQVEDAGSSGQTYPMLTYRDALRRVLSAMMTYTERNGYGVPTTRFVVRDDLVSLSKSIQKDIDHFPDLPLSPLDTIRIALQDRGYQIGELSGRSFQLAWTETAEGQQMRVLQKLAENRNDVVYRFNTDVYQGLLMTRSGSTGLSAHARNDVPGWSPAPRSLFELQIPQNVAERIQFWGRINRRGQCVAPTVVTPSTELPCEVRLIAMQNAKLRRLSANTTSNQDNAALARHIPDLLNTLGNQIARRWVLQNAFDASRLDANWTAERDALPEWYINRIMSRIVLFSVNEQERVLEELAGLYQAQMEEYRNAGIQPLRTAEFDWKAQEVQRDIFESTPGVGHDTDSPFHASVDFVTVQYEEERQPLSTATVRNALAYNASAWKAEPVLREFATLKALKLQQALRPHGRYLGFPDVEAGLADTKPNPVKRTEASLAPIAHFLENVQIGSGIEWTPTNSRNIEQWEETAEEEGQDNAQEDVERQRGLIVALRAPNAEDLHLAGRYQIIVACPGEERFTRVSLSTLQRGQYQLCPPEADSAAILDHFDQAERGTKIMHRNLLIGNLYAALQTAVQRDLGRPAIFTTAEGHRERGVLLHGDVDLKLLRMQPVLLRTAEQLQRFIDDHPADTTTLVSSDTGGRPERYKRGVDFILTLQDQAVTLTIPGAHSRNASLIHDARWQALNVELAGNRTVLSGELPADRLADVIAVLGAQHAWYAHSDYRDWYNRLNENSSVDDLASGPPDPLHTQPWLNTGPPQVLTSGVAP
ncbi:MAG: strawberry notch family protein [Candidatus Competibacteraceae bacterium]|nr:strawberry notch family protein [Candidatus Competibacteraceae bacterium]